MLLAAPATPPGAERAPERPVLRMEGVSLHIGRHAILTELSFDVQPGEIVGLLGANGSGKSTALRLACGLSRPTLGTVGVGRELGPPTTARARADLAMIFQNPSVDPVLTVRENLDFAARSLGMSRGLRAERVDWAIRRAGLESHADARVRTLSGGMRRRVDLGRVLVRPAPLILLDEPSSGLDESSFRSFWADLLSLRDREGCALLVATHRPDEAEHCDRLLVLREGRVVREARPAELVAEIEDDRIEMTTRGPVDDAALDRLREAGLDVTRSGDDGLRLRGPEGARRLAGIVDVVGSERVVSISLHRPTLADAFARLTAATHPEGE